MTIVADRVIVELEAKLDAYNANVRRAETQFANATRAISADAKRMERDIAASSGAVGSQFRAMAATVGAAFSAQQVAAMADSYTRLTNQLKVAGLEGAKLAGTQNDLFIVAQRNGVQWETLGTLYGKATQNQRDLGASSAELLDFTRAVSASLRASGTSAASAQGPLLQLGQALGSPRVQAEEFNSVLEGMPLLLREASKYIDGTGGTLAGLTRKIKDVSGPGVSNVELFRAITQAMADLETRAASTQLTISGAFTNLSNAMTKYIGEADTANGASLAVTEALGALANNLDTATEAIAVLGAVMVGRFVAGMLSGVAASGVASSAIFALQARAVGAATTMEALAFTGAAAGRTLLAAFGGPIGLAVTALTVGIGYLATSSAEAERSADGLAQSIDAQAASFANVTAKQDAANAASGNLDATQRAALVSTANLTGEANLLANAWARVAAQAKTAAVAQAQAAASTARTNRIAAEGAVKTRAAVDARRTYRSNDGSFGWAVGRGARAIVDVLNPQAPDAAAKERAMLAQAQRNEQAANAELARVKGEKLVTFKAPDAPRAAGGGGGKSKAATKPKSGGGAGPKGPDPADVARRFTDDLARAELEIAAAQAEALGTVQARRDFERAQIAANKEQAAREIKANDAYTEAQKARLLSLNEQIAANRLAALAAADAAEKAQAALEVQSAELQDRQDALRLQASLADTAKERRAIELRILDLQYQEEKLRLEAVAASAQSTEAEKEIARRRLAELDGTRDARAKGIERQNESPLEAYRRKMNKSSEQIQEQAEGWVVDELEGIQKSLSSAIQNKIGIKDPILGGIIDLFIEQVIMRPLADAFAKLTPGLGGGLGDIFAGAGGILFGRASGGHVVAGKTYRVNEGGGVEGFRPAGSGQIIPLGQMRGASNGGVTIHQTVKVDASNSVTPDGFAEYIVERTRRETVGIVAQASRQQMQAVPGRMAQYQRDGL